MKGLLNKLKRRIRSRILIDYNKDYSASIFLAGVGRGGTTWISDIINYNNEYRFIFEPFQPYKVNEVKEFIYHQYLRHRIRTLNS